MNTHFTADPARPRQARVHGWDRLLYCLCALFALVQPSLVFLSSLLPLRGDSLGPTGLVLLVTTVALLACGFLFRAGMLAPSRPALAHTIAFKALLAGWLFYAPYILWLLWNARMPYKGQPFYTVSVFPCIVMILTTFRAALANRGPVKSTDKASHL